MNKRTSRREFLKNLVLKSIGTSLAMGGAYSLLGDKAEARRRYKIHDWTGDNFKVGHRLRDLKTPKFPKYAEKKVDVVILGGGLAGLSTAYFLKDRDFLLLEQYDDLGGHSRGASFRGIDYSYAAAYYNDQEGNLAALVSKLGLRPVELNESQNAWYWENTFLKEDKNAAHLLFKEMARLKPLTEKLTNQIGLEPIDSYRENNELKRLDTIRLKSVLNDFDPKFLSLMDSYLMSSLCGGSQEVSALAGLYLLSDLYTSAYVLPGGNQAIANGIVECLSSSHSDSLSSGCFVWSVEIKDEGVSVVYSDRDNRMKRVDANHVVVAIPHMISARLLENIDDRTKTNLFRFRYGSYLVANLLLNKRVIADSYDNWFSSPFEFADITLADTPYLKRESLKRSDASVLTVYQPYGAAGIGRALLYKGNKKELSEKIVEQISSVIPEMDGALEEVVLSRWGHGVAVPTPEYYKRIENLQALERNNLSFAHSSAQCIPCAEAAVDAAKRVTNKLNGKAKASFKRMYFPITNGIT